MAVHLELYPFNTDISVQKHRYLYLKYRYLYKYLYFIRGRFMFWDAV